MNWVFIGYRSGILQSAISLLGIKSDFFYQGKFNSLLFIYFIKIEENVSSDI